MTLIGDRSAATSIALSPDAKRGLIASKSGAWSLYDTGVSFMYHERPQVLCQLAPTNSTDHKLTFTQISLSPDKRVVVATDTATLFMWRIIEGNPVPELLAQFPHLHPDGVMSISWTSDSRLVTTCGVTDLTVRMWNNPTRVALGSSSSAASR